MVMRYGQVADRRPAVLYAGISSELAFAWRLYWLFLHQHKRHVMNPSENPGERQRAGARGNEPDRASGL